MDSAGQLPIFLLCVALGFGGGFVYEAVSVIALPRLKRWSAVLRFIADVLFFVAFALLCVFTAGWFCLPSFRGYYYAGFALGLLIYLKTFHKAVAFFKKICYNSVRKLVNCLKKKKNFRKKEEKKI
jgi:hypothetical protein